MGPIVIGCNVPYPTLVLHNSFQTQNSSEVVRFEDNLGHPPTKAYRQFGAKTGYSGNRYRPLRAAHSSRLGRTLLQLGEQRSGHLQIGGGEALDEPAVDRSKQVYGIRKRNRVDVLGKP
jgi:hypothetical protein